MGSFSKGEERREEKEGKRKKKGRKAGKKLRKGRKKDKRTKIEVWWAKKRVGKQKNMMLPLRFWKAFKMGHRVFKIDGTIYISVFLIQYLHIH